MGQTTRHLILSDDSLSKQSVSPRPIYFDRLIDGELGFDVVWARAMPCPCRSNTQTEQPDPTCASCDGNGILYVHPDPDNNPEQLDQADGRVSNTDLDRAGLPIRCVLTNMMWETDIFDKIGEWALGTARLTVKGNVRVHRFDRFIMVDSELPFTQIIQRGAGQVVSIGRNPDTGLRYPVVQVNELRTETQRWRNLQHFTVGLDGTITFLAAQGPAQGAWFSIHYTYRPRWIVVDFPNSLRGGKIRPKDLLSGEKPKAGKRSVYTQLPTHAIVKLDYLLTT